ncbi:rhombosortase [Shewanella youngdeokensis]|uniref:Rhombosortase n=1 Tax=Shewanella youngdeokensis TaxID=2999068 RepID=A0ABZ0K2C0_9GAMM|nr:rhombosortase [Shewanella sp. DAU334]
MSQLAPLTKRLYLTAALISTLCVVLFYADLADQLAFRRDLITEGQWWRLLTGNFLHTNDWHLLMNLAGLWVILLLHEQHYSATSLSVLVLSLGCMQGLGLLLFFPDTFGYVGLSGLLHGIFVFGAVMDTTKGFKIGYLLTLGVIAKVLYEQWFGASTELTALINATVATEAHLVGLLSGFICLAPMLVCKRMKK